MNSWQLTFLLQTCDSNFPNGAFSHSFGLETLIDQRIVWDESTFRTMLEEWFHLQLVPFEGLAAHLAWARAADHDLSGLHEISCATRVSLLPEHTRQGVLKIGQRTLGELCRMKPNGMTARFAEMIRLEDSSVPFSVAIAVAAADLGIEQSEAVSAILFASVSGMIGSAVRTIPLGQTVGQQLLLDSRFWIVNMPSFEGFTVDDLSSASPLWEIAQMNHKQLDGRLFMS